MLPHNPGWSSRLGKESFICFIGLLTSVVMVLFCQLCLLIAEVRDLATGGGISPEFLEHTERQLAELYALLRLSLE